MHEYCDDAGFVETGVLLGKEERPALTAAGRSFFEKDERMLIHVVEVYDRSDEETLQWYRIRCKPSDLDDRRDALSALLENILHRDLDTAVVYVQE
ncbi:hypothetical protein [Streptomyces chrestomyceticus]|uniref:hypothetical protein n=1 Tax=Streptomyces chrestomyceticus TaxID=68185 RepID=UPI0033CA8E74